MDRWPPRPSLSPAFYKAHGLGNDYLVFEEGRGWSATEGNIRRVCDPHVGVGADGIVALLADSAYDPAERTYRASLRMFNPDGSEFERSGNGLRVLASYVTIRHPEVRTVDAVVGGDAVRMTPHARDGLVHDVSVEMGRATTGAEAVGLDPRALLSGSMAGPDGEPLVVVPVSIGNPHLVVLVDGGVDPDTPDGSDRPASVDPRGGLSEERLERLGPYLSTHPSLAAGANVQLAAPAGPGECRALVWERGVGRTAASGTSACAVAVAMFTSGALPAGSIAVQMPGGRLMVEIASGLDVVLRGPVEEVMEGKLRYSPDEPRPATSARGS